MNQNQRKILEFLKDQDPSKFFSNDEIASVIQLDTTTIGSECYKMREAKLLEHGLAELAVPLSHRITVAGQNKLDDEEMSNKNFNWTKYGIISAFGLSIIAILISILKS